MKLLTKKLEKKLPPLYATENEKDPLVQIKFFCPSGQATWFGIKYSKEERTFFGYVDLGFGGELGYFSLDELETLKCPMGLSVERDTLFKPIKLSSVKQEHI